MRKIKQTAALILCVSAFSLFALGSGSDESSTASKVGETSSTETEEQVESTKQDLKSEYYVGDTLYVDGLEITYTGSNNYISDNQFIQPADGNKYIRLAFHVANKSDSDKSVSTFEFKCYADGYECQATYQDDDLSASLSKGRSADGAVYFEVPVDAKEIEVEYEVDWFNDKKVKFIFEGEKDSGLVFEKESGVTESAFHVGDIIETKKLRIVYNKADEYVSDNMFLQAPDGKKYVYIELEVENLSESDQNISFYSFNCYADGNACDGYYGMDDLLSADISAGRKAKGTIAFEVPENAKTIEFEFEDNFWTESKIVFLYE